jgi:hypothetical protein
LFSLITGIKINMLLIFVLGLVAKLVLVSGECSFGNPTQENFDYAQVSISVLTCLL